MKTPNLGGIKRPFSRRTHRSTDPVTAQDQMNATTTLTKSTTTPPENEKEVSNHSSSGADEYAVDHDHSTFVPPKYIGFSGIKLSWAIGVASGAGFLMFGYDQGVMGSLFTLKSFREKFDAINTTDHKELRYAVKQGLTTGLYEIGCLVGSLACIVVGDWWGRRKVIFWGVLIMIIGAILQCTSFSLAQLIVARIVTGVGNGMKTATIPPYQSECSPAHLRGRLIMIEGALITGGIMLSYWIDFAFFWLQRKHPDSPHVDASWRVPLALQIVLALPTLFLVMFLCESPRFLMLKGEEQEARKVLSSLNELPPDHPEINVIVTEMRASISEARSLTWRELFTNGPTRNLHRACLGFISQCFQQISGINLITYYAGTLFENNLGFEDMTSRVLAAANGTEYFAASWIAVWLVERSGRRPLMLFGAAGQCLTMMVLAITNAPSVTHPKYKASIDAVGGTNTAASVIATVCLFLFNTFFAIGWLGMTWLTPAEMTPLVVRAACNGISTASNWLFNFIVVMVTPISFNQIDYNTYTVFCIMSAFIFVCTYLIFPETAGRSLEEMDEIFAKSSKVNWFDVVLVERRTPRKYDRHGHPIQAIQQLNETQGVTHPIDDHHGDGNAILIPEDDVEHVGSFTHQEQRKKSSESPPPVDETHS